MCDMVEKVERSIQALYLKLLEDKKWEPDDKLRREKVIALYAAMVGNPNDLFAK